MKNAYKKKQRKFHFPQSTDNEIDKIDRFDQRIMNAVH